LVDEVRKAGEPIAEHEKTELALDMLVVEGAPSLLIPKSVARDRLRAQQQLASIAGHGWAPL
jgi:hypothetical protein